MKKYALAVGAVGSLLAASAQASTMNFNNGSGSYTADGVTATVTVTTAKSGQGLHYNGVENAIGVGSNNTDGGIGFKELQFFVIPVFTEAETMTVSFDSEVRVDATYFRQWENKILCCGDKVYFDYSGGGSGSGTLTFEESGQFGLIDGFDVGGLSMTSFTIRPEQDGNKANGASADTSVYLHSIDFTEVPVPAAAWLFGSAMLGLAGVARRRAS